MITKANFEKLLAESFPKIKNYIFKKVAGKKEAEEVLEETLVSASESFSFFEGKSSFFTWVCGIANHEIADFYRKRKIKTLLFSHFPFLENIISEALSADESLEKQELRKEVKKVLSCLTEGYGEILRLKYYQGLSMAEIARKLKTTVKAVESRLSRARGAFRVAWHLSVRDTAVIARGLSPKQSQRSPRPDVHRGLAMTKYET